MPRNDARLPRNLHQLVEELHIGVILQGPSAEIYFCNQAALDLLGLTEDQLLGRTSFDPGWNVLRPDGSAFPGSQHPVPLAISTGLPVRNVTMGVERPEVRDRVWLLVDAVPRLDPEGNVVDVLCTFSDITEKRAISEELRNAKKMEAVGRVARGLAHDLSGMVTAILGQCDALSLGELPDHIRPSIEAIRGAAERAADLSRGLLHLARPRLGSLRTFDLNASVRSFASLFGRLGSSGVNVEQQLSSEPCLVFAAPEQIDQVLLNIGLNAKEAMPGGGTLSLSTSLVDIPAGDPRPLTPGPHVLLTVTDTGQGMDPATKERVFEPYFSTRGEGRGNGLGLAIVYAIVHESGGAISVSSAPGTGSTFRVLLPLAHEPLAPEPLAHEPAAEADRQG